ncbi:hypothetical protein [Arenibaculum pallidiluteum]|uniref:hypothetical protein n=1 Tax=Arenibaculum pallidiluteum TaxID=2812559 RepID=UPI001A96BC63|nr:hypothetical protein [Arenibaculum pallidiluteum]
MQSGDALWLFGTIGGALILGLAFLYGLSRNRRLRNPPASEAGNGLQPNRLSRDQPTAVRVGSREGVVSPILAISLGLVVVAMILAFVFAV